jgi:uncharacterized protein (TIGR03118 family)
VVKPLSRNLASAVVIAVALTGATAVRADDDGFKIQRNAYVVNKLVSDQNGVANFQDPVLRNAWGVAFTPGASPFWIADNASGCSTLYDGTGVKVALQVPIPLPDNSVPSTACQPASAQTNPPPPTPAAPTGLVWNPTTTFLVPGTSTAASFIFATEDGTISAWANGASGKPNNQAVIAFDNSASGAVYKGLVFGTNTKGVFLFATNFHAGTVDVFKPADNTSNGQYIETTTTGRFKDSNIPAGFAPFGIENINGDLFVSYAKQNAAMHDDLAGPGNGFVDVFDTDGNLLRRFASRGALNSPWGTRASFAFGRFSGLILIGNFGNGKINVFSSQGQFVDELDRPSGKPLVIDGLWKLILGGGRNSSSDTLYFTGGPNDETNGLFGTITPTSKQ